MNLPNFLSLLRLLSVPVFIWLVADYRMEAAFWLFVCSGITDALDGFIAKRFNQTTTLGSYLDPIADKMLLVSAFIIMTMHHYVPLWLTLMVVSRDLLIVVGALIYHFMFGALRIETLWISKLNTAAQLSLMALILWLNNPDYHAGVAERFGIWFVAATTLASGGWYVVVWTRRAMQHER